ncbi:MAG: putative dsRNA-binding protein [Bacteroidetes bacterium]|nr:putative dsRNA-binding protein [Bacteroidota bacterium]
MVADYLFKIFPLKDEGFLTEMRSKMVSRVQLNKLSLKLGLDKFIESQQDYSGPNKSMMGDAFEAFIGALYIDKGYNFTKDVIVNNIIAHHFDMDELETTETNYKSKILEWSQKEKIPVEFVVISETGSSHKKQYIVEVQVDNQGIAKGVDYSIKGAEQFAAEKAFDILQLNR